MMKGARMLEGVASRGGMIPWLCDILSFSSIRAFLKFHTDRKLAIPQAATRPR